jgi:hypothetical protein
MLSVLPCGLMVRIEIRRLFFIYRPTSDLESSSISAGQLKTGNQDVGLALTVDNSPGESTADAHADADINEPPAEPVIDISPGIDLGESVFQIVHQYVYNNVPINLLHLPDMVMYGRDALSKKVAAELLAELRATNDMVDGFHDALLEAEYEASFGKADKTPREKVEDAARFRLRYAIFSHRWCADGEPTYEDLLQYARIRTRPAAANGFRKLENFCLKAMEDYLCEWAWSDTCCIDKRNSAELDESIRSMFRWYSSSHVCIVHLTSTVGLLDMTKDIWFTRGWTLQELLAPMCIKFYSCNWQPISDMFDDKLDDALMSMVSDITTISLHDLRWFTPGVERIREKMVWASKRTTTRAEDIAYSLLGLLGVSIPIAYGEGPIAFYRLQAAIAEQTNNTELFMWSGPFPRNRQRGLHNIFASSPRCFTPTARYDELHAYLGHRSSSPDFAERTAEKFISRGGLSFALTNGGLRIDALLYSARHLSSLEDWKAGPRRWYTHTFEVEILGQQVVMLALDVVAIRGELAVAVIDYERGDAYGTPFMSLGGVEIPTVTFHGSQDPSDLEKETQCIVSARCNRWYAAIMLFQDTPGHFERIASKDIIFVNRPVSGWGKRPETVYIR